ncbi:MAG: heavy metal translocating P-type ATPase, partial [Pirellulaceae bacterium]|nr:heavy metal translocating P-type ATPase [Pirellulaceae bacterium]
MDKTQLDIELALPEVTDLRDECIVRLNGMLESRAGIDKAHVREHDGEANEKICIHFDPDKISIGEIRQFAIQAGTELGHQYGHLLLKSAAMDTRKARKVNDQLTKIKGVLDSGVSADGIIRIEYARDMTTESSVLDGVKQLGIRVHKQLVPVVQPKLNEQHTDHDHSGPDHDHDDAHDHKKSGGAHDHKHGGIFGERSELIFAIICGVLLLTGWLISFSSSINTWIPWAFYAGAYFFGGYYIVREAIEKILLQRFEIDFLMIVAAIGAAILGAWAEGALLLFLFAIGHALENYAMGRARQAIEALANLAPETAVVRRNESTQEIPVEELVRGDIVVVKTNERIAADGFVVKGQSSVDQAAITGESVPVDKQPVIDPVESAKNPSALAPENRVFAGTINQSGSLEIQVTQLASESTLARVVTMVSEAETQQSPTQQFTDKFEKFFVPAVVALAVILLFAFLVIDEPFSASFYRAMAVLVAASPCALAIATPSAVLSGVARAARGGVLIKGGGPLENLGRLTAIAFDKTGTLTEGKPRITDVVPYGDVSEGDFLRTAIAVEKLSDHPLAAAVVRDGLEKLNGESIPEATDLQSITGRGIKATVDGQPVYIGKDDLFAEVDGPALPDDLRETVEQLESQGRTTMIVRRGEQFLGVIGLMDTPREAAKSMIANLRELGIERMIMISGDNQQVANAVAKEVGIDDAWGDLMPNDKVEAIKKLRSEGDVAMVGDGVNDAPAMANATVGIAMGAAGSDVALETADVALMADELSHLPFAVGLSRQTSRIIRQNLWYSLGMVAILVPATILGLNIGFAVLLHEG